MPLRKKKRIARRDIPAIKIKLLCFETHIRNRERFGGCYFETDWFLLNSLYPDDLKSRLSVVAAFVAAAIPNIFAVILEIYRENLRCRWNSTIQKSLKIFSTAPDSGEAHAALATAQALAPSITFGLGSLSLSMQS